jgi:hypothetical protein
MKYFRLLDDVQIPGRWYLGELIDSKTRSPLELWRGVPFCQVTEIELTEMHPGVPLDFSLTSFATPVATERLSVVVGTVAGPDVQLLPVRIPCHGNFRVLNCTRVIKCLDERESEFIKWTLNDHRADLAGQYRMVTKLRIKPPHPQENAHFFRIAGWPIALIASESMKSAMESCGCFGAKFEEVTI